MHTGLYIVLLMCNVPGLHVNVVSVLVALREEVSSVGVCCVISDCSGYVNPIPHRSGEGRGREEEERGRHCYTQSAQTDGRRGTEGGLQHFTLFFPPTSLLGFLVSQRPPSFPSQSTSEPVTPHHCEESTDRSKAQQREGSLFEKLAATRTRDAA